MQEDFESQYPQFFHRLSIALRAIRESPLRYIIDRKECDGNGHTGRAGGKEEAAMGMFVPTALYIIVVGFLFPAAGEQGVACHTQAVANAGKCAVLPRPQKRPQTQAKNPGDGKCVAEGAVLLRQWHLGE